MFSIRLRDRFRSRVPALPAIALAMLGFSGVPAAACGICIVDMPDKTMADRVLESDAVVLAREVSGKPFAFTPVSVLKGSLPPDPIPYLVDSATRRKLGMSPEDAVLLVWTRLDTKRFGPFAGGPSKAEWMLLGYAGPEYQRLVARILAHGDDWQRDRSSEDRLRFFEALHDHPDQTIRLVALSELARAPYGFIRRVSTRLTLTEITRTLRNQTMMRWAPIHILLLGRSDDPGSRELVRGAVEAAASLSSQANLAAWATALVEIDGRRGVDALARAYFGVPTRSDAELKEVVTALGVQGSEGEPSLRPAIMLAFHELANDRPQMAPYVAVHLADWNDWSQADAFLHLLQTQAIKAPEEVFMLSVYVNAARDRRDMDGTR